MLNYDYQLEPLRTWFLNESPKNSVLMFKEKCDHLLVSPETFMEMVVDNDFMGELQSYINDINHAHNEITKINNFISHNKDEEDGFTAFEYIMMSKKTLSDESVSFINDQFNFIRDMHNIASHIKATNTEDAYQTFVNQVKDLLKEVCAKREKLSSYLTDYSIFISECLTVAEANEKYKEIAEDETDNILNENAYDSFMKNGKVFLDNVMRAKMMMEG